MTILLTHAFQFALFWVLMWTAFLTEQGAAYPEAPMLKYNIYLWLAFWAVYLGLVIRCGAYSRYIVNTAIVVAVGVIGLLEVEKVSGALVGIFGTRGSLDTYISMFFVLLIIYFRHVFGALLLLVNLLLGNDPKSDDSDLPKTA